MADRRWKKKRPTDLRHAMELCLEYARVKHNRSVERVADLMGIASKWTLYKWMESGKLPAIYIRAFEHATGANYVTQWVAASDHKLLIDIPVGRGSSASDLTSLQGHFAEAMFELARFYQNRANTDDTLKAIHEIMAGLAYHRENVVKMGEPELGLFEEAEE